MPERTYAEAITDALAEELRANPKIIVIAEDGAVSPAVARLRDEFGAERIRSGDAGPATLAGAAVGAALCGYRPVLELAGAESLPAALAQLAAEGAKAAAAPLVMRVACGDRIHSSLASCWTLVPEMRVAAPATPADAKGLLRTALRDAHGPAVFLEHARLYDTKGDVPAGDYTVTFGVAAVRRPGKQLTVVAYGALVNAALAACEQLAREGGADAELLDLRTLQPCDLPAILASLRKTGRVLLCACASAGFSSELAQCIGEQGFDDLDAPVRRVRISDPDGAQQAIAQAIAALAAE